MVLGSLKQPNPLSGCLFAMIYPELKVSKMKKSLLPMMLILLTAHAQAEVMLGCWRSKDGEREQNIAAQVQQEFTRSQTLLRDRAETRAELEEAQQLWQQFVVKDCDYNHSQSMQNCRRHSCTMQHYQQRLQDLKQRNDNLERQKQKFEAHHSAEAR
jgi:hypothetical protein